MALVMLTILIVSTQSRVSHSVISYQTYSASDYDEARALQCNVGDIVDIIDPPGGRFDCVDRAEAWRHPFFDDGGLQLASADSSNIWKRRFGHTASDPIRLDWFEWMDNGARIDTLFTHLDGDLGSSVYVRMPGSIVPVDTLTWYDYHELHFSDFHWTESDQPIDVVQQGGLPDSIGMLGINDYVSVRIGGPNHNIRFVGLHPGNDCDYPLTDTACFTAISPNSLGEGENRVNGMLEFRQVGTGGIELSVEVDGLNCGQRLLSHTGGENFTPYQTLEATLSGYWDNCAGRVIGGVRNLELDLTSTDPNGVGLGWKGTPFPENNECGGDLDQKSRAFFLQRLNSLSGRITLRFGWARWFIADVDRIGNSASDRFEIRMDSLGWTSASSYLPSTQIDANRADGCESQGGKADSFAKTGQGRRWFRIVQLSPEFNLDYGFILEATSVGGNFFTSYGDFELDGLQNGHGANRITRRHISEEEGDRVFGHVFRNSGNPVLSPLVIHDSTVVEHGTFADIVVSGANNCIVACPPTSNYIRDVVLTGAITEQEAPVDTTFVEGVTFSGQPRQVIAIQGIVSVPFDNRLIAPVGSTIAGSGELICSGISQPLPYTFDGQPDDCETVQTSASFDVISGWNIVSVPIRTMNMAPAAVFPQAVSSAYTFGTTYQKHDKLATGSGYWLKFASAASVDLDGRPGAPTDVPVSAGWNLIGPFETPIGVGQVTSTPADILASDFFGYNGGYSPAETLEPGSGYWVRVTESGQLHLGPTGGKRLISKAAITGARLEFTDSNGSTGLLYLSEETLPGQAFELPPPPPLGAFDVRFDDNTYVAELDREEHMVKLRTQAYPVRVAMRDLPQGKLHLQDTFGGKVFAASIGTGEEALIPEGIGALVVSLSETSTAEGTVSHNYPNPFAETTVVRIRVPRDSNVKVDIYDILGRLVSTAFEGRMEAGEHVVTVDAADLGSGLYICRVQTDDFTSEQGIIVAR